MRKLVSENTSGTSFFNVSDTTLKRFLKNEEVDCAPNKTGKKRGKRK